MRRKYIILALVFIFIFILHRIVFMFVISSFTYTTKINTNEEQRAKGKYKSPLIILAWTKWFGSDFNALLNDLNKPLDNECPELYCELSTNRSSVSQSHAVVFHIRDLNSSDLPDLRKSWQRYVFFLMESPKNTLYNLKNSGNYFNWTMTYRRDSDIFYPYTIIEKGMVTGPSKRDSNWKAILRSKSKFAVWPVSNCNTHSNRELLMEELKKQLSIDVWGSCGDARACPSNNNNLCLQMMNTHFKFVFALENSVCKDYVTEKYWSRASLNIVPIVLNRTILEPFAPENSFIAVDDFKNLQEMVGFLKEVDGNDTKYMQYIMAKQNNASPFIHEPSPNRGFCKLCELLRISNNPQKSYRNIHDWWETTGECLPHVSDIKDFFRH